MEGQYPEPWSISAALARALERIAVLERQLAEARDETLQMQRAIRAEDQLAEAREAIKLIADKRWPGHVTAEDFAREWLVEVSAETTRVL